MKTRSAVAPSHRTTNYTNRAPNGSRTVAYASGDDTETPAQCQQRCEDAWVQCIGTSKVRLGKDAVWFGISRLASPLTGCWQTYWTCTEACTLSHRPVDEIPTTISEW